MANRTKLILLFLAVVVCSNRPLSARAEDAAAEKPWSLDSSVSFLTDYMFRGQNLYDGTSIQPTTTFSYDTGGFGTLSGNLWMHLSAEGDRQDTKFTELDESISYEIDFEPVSLKAGFVWYTFPDNNDDINDTSEFFAGITLDDSEMSPFPLSPSLTYYKDYREIDYNWFELTFSHKCETDALGKGFNATPYVTFGFASNSEAVYEDDGLETIVLGISHEATVGDITLIPSLSYTFKVDDNTVNEFTVAVSFGYSV